MERTFAIVWDRRDVSAAHRAARLAERLRSADSEWAVAFETAGCVVLQCRGRVLALAGVRGVIVGELFARSCAQQAPVIARRALAQHILARDRGQLLIEEYWGDYLAVFHDPHTGQVDILRDPSGARECFVGASDGLRIVFTHPDDAKRSGALALEVDWQAVTWFLMRQNLQTRRTGFSGVSELQPGERVSFKDGAVTRQTLWSPHSFCGSQAGSSFEARAAQLRETIDSCARAWAKSAAPTILHRLSGGLDSAIVLSALARAAERADIVCVNYYADAFAGADERAFARAAARRFGVRLIEQEMTPQAVDYRAVRAPLHARPSTALLSFADPRPAEIAAKVGAALTTSGAGGDNLFYRVRSALIAADALRARPFAAASYASVLDQARAARRSVWSVAADAVQYGCLRRPAPLEAMFAAHTRLMAPDVAASVGRDDLRHGWVREAGPIAPGKLAHLWMLADALNYRWPSVISSASLYRPVLLSQPIIEACLATPTYVLTAGGRDRALARTAFAQDLPPEIARRDSKGVTTAYFAAVLEHNAPFLRDTLLDGMLCARGLLDKAALERALSAPLLARGENAAHLLTCLAAEMWLSL